MKSYTTNVFSKKNCTLVLFVFFISYNSFVSVVYCNYIIGGDGIDFQPSLQLGVCRHPVLFFHEQFFFIDLERVAFFFGGHQYAKLGRGTSLVIQVTTTFTQIRKRFCYEQSAFPFFGVVFFPK